MEVDAPWFFASLVVSGAGFVAFMYGRRQKRLPQMVAGVALIVYPYFVGSVWLMLGIAAAILVALLAALRAGW
jgi:hypothetical protein